MQEGEGENEGEKYWQRMRETGGQGWGEAEECKSERD